MKKLTAILLAILMLIPIIASCGGNDETTITEIPTTEAPTTEAPTTEAPTTEAPTTEIPTTEAPTTEIPTTKPTGEYNIKYELNGGTNNENNPSTYDTGDTITLGRPTKEDYMFMGWYTDSEFTNEIKEITDKTGDLILHADWIPLEDIFDIYKYGGVNGISSIKENVTAKTIIVPSSYKGEPLAVHIWMGFQNDFVEEIIFTREVSITKYVTFGNAPSLKRIIVEEDNPYMKSIDGVLYSKDGKELICYPAGKEGTSYVIQDGTESVKRLTFCNNKYIESVVVPDSITFIDAYAFLGCTSLKDVKLSKNLEIIDDCVFQNCVSLKKITIPDSVKSIGHFVFDDCTSLTEIYIPNGVENISYDIFRSAPNVTVYCEAEEKPSGWDTYWHRDAKEIIWGYKAEE